MEEDTDDLRIREIKELSTPAEVIAEYPRDSLATRTVAEARRSIRDILQGEDDRLVVVIGPCSIHDTQAAEDYAARLRPLRDRLGDRLEIVMRVY
ncbi:MAG: 3-deoxy-7-phosphoheptulonate synthase, partial [Bauldia sp.]|nr:3-deoxy-7-phosphoheptulonate synthase [Bauldia sp.]